MLKPGPLRPHVRAFAAARPRQPSLVASLPWPAHAADPPRDALVAQLALVPGAASWTLAGGEPTTRADLPALIRALADAGAPDLGLATDGLSLAAPRVAETLRDAGLGRVTVSVYSARIDAHDWLAGTPGGLRRVRAGVERARAAGLAVELEITLTRPTTPYAEETVELAAALGARGVVLRAADADWLTSGTVVALCPRVALLRPAIEAAWRAAGRRGLAFRVAGVPRCAVGAAEPARDRPGAERWLLPDGDEWAPLAAAVRGAAAPGCPSCSADCAGPSATYVRLMGRSEFDPVPTAAAYAPAEPPSGTERLEVPAHRSTRDVRLDLVRAVQRRPERLELVGLLAHPKAPELVSELRVLEPELRLVDHAADVAARSDALLKRLAPHAELAVVVPAGAESGDAVGPLSARLTALGVRHTLRPADPHN